MEDIEAKVVEYLAAIDDLGNAVGYEPEKLPRMPCTTLLVGLFDPHEAETGSLPLAPHDDVTYGWRLRLYVSLTDYERAQTQIKSLIPQIIHAIRAHPTCDGLVDFLRVRDPGGTPNFSSADGWATKDLELRAVRTES